LSGKLSFRRRQADLLDCSAKTFGYECLPFQCNENRLHGKELDADKRMTLMAIIRELGKLLLVFAAGFKRSPGFTISRKMLLPTRIAASDRSFN